jgi:deoxyribodipyrimidine photolyase-related protein
MNLVIFPHQLYNPKFIDLKNYKNIIIIEEPRFFTDFLFHKLKLAYHRATMKKYYDTIKKIHQHVKYIEFSKVNNVFYKKLEEINIYDPYDKKLIDKLNKLLKVNIIDNLQFLVSSNELTKQDKYRHDSFYKFMRIKYNILVDNKNKPIGGQWSFDKENRLKFPNDIKVPPLPRVKNNKYIVEAKEYVNRHFPNNYGSHDYFIYPIDHKSTINWLNNFLSKRLKLFGKYEDGVSTKHSFGFHSVLSPMMNIGLLRDIEVLEISNNYYNKNKSKIPIESYEGFIRQIIGWRQYVYCLYTLEGHNMEKSNLLNHKNKLNEKWWDNVGITPINFLIEKIKKYAYVHHIERLMFLSNWLLLNQIHPKEVYRIFMEWTIDAYDWVMVPNVFGMGQASSDIMMTRVYFSSSNYILKMSDFKNDESNWIKTWDALYYNFIKDHKTKLAANYATAMQVKHYNNKTSSEKNEIELLANNYFKFLKL